MLPVFRTRPSLAVPAGPSKRAASDPSPVIASGLLVIAITFLGFGLWAGFAPLAKGSHVMGTIISDGQRKTIQHLEGGVVKEIVAQEGDRVKPGDVILRLSETQARAALEVMTSRRMQEQLVEARLVAERDGAERIAWPEDAAKARLDDRTRAAMADQAVLFAARKKELDGQVHSTQERAAQLKRQLVEINHQLAALQEQQRSMAIEADALRALEKQGFETMDRVRSAEREAERLRGDMATRRAGIAEIESQIQAAELQIFQMRDSFRRQVTSDLRDSRTRLNEIYDQITVAQDISERTTIRSPVAGQIVGLTVHTVGGVLKGGETICYVAPENEHLLIEARVKPEDADAVRPGLKAEIRLSSLPRRAVPLLFGRVLSFATDTLSDPATRESYYLARVEANPGELDKLKEWNIVAGMPVEVMIVSGERTLLDYLVTPVEQLFSRAMREE